MSETIKLDYEDAAGIRRRVLLPKDCDDCDPSEGIPLSLDLDAIYEHLPLLFRVRLYNALWDQGLIEPQDYLQPKAAERYMAAMRTVIKHDAFDAIAIAKERCK